MYELFYGYNPENIYLDNGASTLSLKKAKEQADEFLLSYGSLHRGSGYNSEVSTMKYEESRDKILHFLYGTENDCVIFTSNTTDAINKFCLIYPNKGKVLISDIEHTSNLLPWTKHFETKVFKTMNFVITPEVIAEELKKDPEISIVAISAASNITGYITKIKEIYEICKKKHVILFVDASQYAPHACPDLRFADVIAYCGHKIGAPYGAGVLAGRKELLKYDNLSITGGGNVLYVDQNNTPIYKGLPYIHEAGTPNGIGAVTLKAAHELLFEEIGEERLSEHNEKLNQSIRICSQRLRENGYEVYFTEYDHRTPIMIVNNIKRSNKETVKLLNTKIGEFDKNVFVREGAFCAYRILEMLFPELAEIKDKITEGHLNERYSLIRLSGGLINEPEDFYYATDKLIYINRGLPCFMNTLIKSLSP